MTVTEPTTSAGPYLRHAGPHTSAWYVGHFFTFLAGEADTNGQLSVMEATVRKGLEPPAHTHTHEDEAYYVLAGQFTFTVGDQVIDAGPGSFVYMPRGLPHTFTVDADGARALVICTPAGLEDAFRQMSEPAGELALPPLPAGPPPIERMVAAFGARGVQFVRPDGPPAP